MHIKTTLIQLNIIDNIIESILNCTPNKMLHPWLNYNCVVRNKIVANY